MALVTPMRFTPAVSAEEELSEENRKAIGEQKAQLEGLTKSPAWGMVVAFIESQCAKRTIEIMLKPVADEKDKVQEAYSKGEYAGLMLVKTFIESELGVQKEAVDLYRQLAREQGEVG